MEGFHRGAVGGGEGQPAAGRPAGDRVLGVSPAALAGASGRPEARGCGDPAPGAQTTAHLRPAGQLPVLHGGLPAAPAAGAAGRRRLFAGAQLRPAGAQGERERRRGAPSEKLASFCSLTGSAVLVGYYRD